MIRFIVGFSFLGREEDNAAAVHIHTEVYCGIWLRSLAEIMFISFLILFDMQTLISTVRL